MFVADMASKFNDQTRSEHAALIKVEMWLFAQGFNEYLNVFSAIELAVHHMHHAKIDPDCSKASKLNGIDEGETQIHSCRRVYP